MQIQKQTEELIPVADSPMLRARLQCPRCSVLLEPDARQLLCTRCGRSWPVENGVPRFFRPDYYWGELSQNEAGRFIKEAADQGWRSAVQNRFRNEPDMLISLLDWQRVSWLPLLALPPDSIALDVGSGYGAITHALSAHVSKVYSVEAVPERVEFSRVRFEQEGIDNVQLIQASGMSLPFPDGLFDLIIVNGVLEWVGEWERGGDPRAIQRDFLRRIRDMLRENGKLVIGIENRFGQGLFRGGKDHSGIAYTSLMPRWMASLYMRHNRQPHHRMDLNPRRQYRTYTYSKRGYQKLLNESGFGVTDFYWADPGYNQPYALIPLRGESARKHFRRKRAGLQYGGGTWRRLAANAISRSATFLAPDFVILAQKNGGSTAPAVDFLSMPGLLGFANAGCRLYTGPFSYRSVIWLSDPAGKRPHLILKISDGTPLGATAVAAEFSNLSLATKKIARATNPLFSVPAPGMCSEHEKSDLRDRIRRRWTDLGVGFCGIPLSSINPSGAKTLALCGYCRAASEFAP